MVKNAIFILLVVAVLMTSFVSVEDDQFETLKFPSADELAITADLYKIESDKPAILLCHQAGYSRGEYREIALQLNKLGFSCMAIDQRSGSKVNDVVNLTAKSAANAKLARQYADAEQDITAAIDYLHKLWDRPVIIWGSSYSASLVLKLGKGNAKVKAILAFSPGEYIKGTNITESVSGLKKSLFATSSKNEASDVKKLISGVDDVYKTQFIPEGGGQHGSKALWTRNDGYKEYWSAVESFLAKI